MGPRPRLWAGPEVGGRLLSSLFGYWGGPNEIYTYGDCGYFNPDRCKRPLSLESIPACGVIDEIEFGDRKRMLRMRGVPVGRSWERGPLLVSGSILLSGRAGFAIGEVEIFSENKGRRNTFADHRQMINQLRPVGKPLVPGSKLPARIKVNCKR